MISIGTDTIIHVPQLPHHQEARAEFMDEHVYRFCIDLIVHNTPYIQICEQSILATQPLTRLNIYQYNKYFSASAFEFDSGVVNSTPCRGNSMYKYTVRNT